VRKILFLFSLWFALTLMWSTAAATLTMTDGSTVEGDIVKFDDSGLMLRSGSDSYTNLTWSQFSQETLKQLSANQKIKPLVEVFLEPDAAQRPVRAETNVNPVKRLEMPQNSTVLGGLLKSPVGLAILLVLYLANLYAGFEVSVMRSRSALPVVGLAAVLPIIGPMIFLVLPGVEEATAEKNLGTAAAKPEPTIEIAEASWRQAEEKKPEAQIFTRGKYTFNKRFIETKFANFVGVPQGDALKFAMAVRTTTAFFAVERIAQVAATDVIFETPNGQMVVALADIQEIKLNPKSS
jgi:hypothetical protein